LSAQQNAGQSFFHSASEWYGSSSEQQSAAYWQTLAAQGFAFISTLMPWIVFSEALKTRPSG